MNESGNLVMFGGGDAGGDAGGGDAGGGDAGGGDEDEQRSDSYLFAQSNQKRVVFLFFLLFRGFFLFFFFVSWPLVPATDSPV